MSMGTTIFLGALAGLTIFLGLPFARMQRPPRSLQAFLNAIATGVLVFLLYDVLAKASEPIHESLVSMQKEAAESSTFFLYSALLAVGLGVGALSLVYFRRFAMQSRPDDQSESDPRKLALAIATGIGLHNFSEGLAIGQASSSGALSLAMVLIIGFGLHNMTEGFAIAAPLIGRHLPSWRFLTLAGLIAGGPTFLGTVLGMAFVSTAVFVLFLSLAGGAILYVVGELLHVDRMLRAPVAGMYGLLVGFLAGYGSDLIVTWSGA